jgi:hypothetical protein
VGGRGLACLAETDDDDGGREGGREGRRRGRGRGRRRRRRRGFAWRNGKDAAVGARVGGRGRRGGRRTATTTGGGGGGGRGEVGEVWGVQCDEFEDG